MGAFECDAYLLVGRYFSPPPPPLGTLAGANSHYNNPRIAEKQYFSTWCHPARGRVVRVGFESVMMCGNVSRARSVYGGLGSGGTCRRPVRGP